MQHRLDASWWRNATVYQIYPRSFADADGDGLGDIPGVTSRLDYLSRLGVDAIWLSPFYPSPLKDGGYDVADYRDVDPRLGTLEDFTRLTAEAHARGIRVVIDIVPNHTSDRHPWFTKALSDGPLSDAAQRYVFRRGRGEGNCDPPTNWISNFGGSAWEPVGDGWFYLHLFSAEQPDLNWDNPDVRSEFVDILRFWCDRGVDGFRIDVSHALSKDLREPLRDRPNPTVAGPDAQDGSDPLWDRDDVHGIYRQWREALDSYDEPKYAVGETWSPFSDRVFAYARQDELGAVFDFSLLKSSFDHDSYRSIITRTWQGATSVGAAPTWVLGNHDVPRIASRLGLGEGVDIEHWVTSGGTDPGIDPLVAARRARAATLMILGLPGTVFLYQGDELGLPEDFDIPDDEVQDPLWERTGHVFKGRDGCRVPLPWVHDAPAFGFNDTGRTWLGQPGWFERHCADLADGDPTSLLTVCRSAIRLRRDWVSRDNDALDYEWIEEECQQAVLSWSLPSGMRVMVNFSDSHAAPIPPGYEVAVSSELCGCSDQGVAVAPEATVWLVPVGSLSVTEGQAVAG